MHSILYIFICALAVHSDSSSKAKKVKVLDDGSDVGSQNEIVTAVYPDGSSSFYSCTNGGTVTKWASSNSAQLSSFKAHDENIVSMYNDDQYLYTVSAKAIKVWIKTLLQPFNLKALRYTLRGHLNAVAVVSKGTVLYSAGQDARIRKWNMITGGSVGILPALPAKINCMIISGDSLFVGLADNTVREIHTDSGAITATYFGHTGPITALYVVGKFLFSASSDKTAKMWDNTLGNYDSTLQRRLVYNWHVKANFTGVHTDAIKSIVATPKTVFTGSSDKSVVEWDFTGKPVASHSGHTGAVNGLLLNGPNIISCSSDKKIKKWTVGASAPVVTETSIASSVSLPQDSGSVGLFNIPADYVLSFTITPTTEELFAAQILSILAPSDVCCGTESRPFIGFGSESTQLVVNFDGSLTTTLTALPLNYPTLVMIVRKGIDAWVVYNQTIQYQGSTTASVKADSANVFVGSDVGTSATAVITDLKVAQFQSGFNIPGSKSDESNVVNLITAQETLSTKHLGFVDFSPDYSLYLTLTLSGSSTSAIKSVFTTDFVSMAIVALRPRLILFSSAGSSSVNTPALTLNYPTAIKIIAFKNEFWVIYNETIVSQVTATGRKFGQTGVFSGNPKVTPVTALIKDFSVMPYLRISQDITTSPVLLDDTNEIPITKRFLANITVPSDYIIRFTLRPTGLSTTVSNILQVQGATQPKMPYIYFQANSYIPVYSSESATVALPALPVNALTTIMIAVKGSTLWAFYNGSLVLSFSLTGSRTSSHAFVFIGHPLNTPAKANMKGVFFAPYSESAINIVGWPGVESATVTNTKNLLGSTPLSLSSVSRFLGAITVPDSYVISMFVTPLGKVSTLSSILHATKSGFCCGSGTRGPLIGFNPGSLAPFVSFGSANAAEFGGILPELTLNTETKITLIQNGLDVYALYNDVVVFAATADSARPSGAYYFYLGSVFSGLSNANVAIRSIDISAYSDSLDISGFSVAKITNDLAASGSITALPGSSSVSPRMISKINLPSSFIITATVNIKKSPSSATTFFGTDFLRLNVGSGGTELQLAFKVTDGTSSYWQSNALDTIDLNSPTEIKIYAYESNFWVVNNGTNVTQLSIPANTKRPFGVSNIFVGGSNGTAFDGEVSSIVFNAFNPLVDITASPVLINDEVPVSKKVIANVSIPIDYVLRLTLRPTRVIKQVANILQFSRNGSNDDSLSKMPYLYFCANSTIPNFGWGSYALSLTALPMNAPTTITIVAKSTFVWVYYNSTLLYVTESITATRPSGYAMLFSGFPADSVASASISAFSLAPYSSIDTYLPSWPSLLPTDITTSTTLVTDELNLVSSSKLLGNFSLPVNYTISFVVKPLGTMANASVLFQASQTSTFCCEPGSRGPLIGFAPGSTAIDVRVGSNDGYWGMSGTALNVNESTTVTVSLNGLTLTLSYNGIVVATTSGTSRPPTGYYYTYAGSPWGVKALPAKAVISSLSIAPL